MTRYNTEDRWVNLGQGYLYQTTDAGTLLRNSHNDQYFFTGEEEEDFLETTISILIDGRSAHSVLKGFFE